MNPPIAIVTGGARNLGRAIALALARDGFGVVATVGSDGETAQRTAEEISGQAWRHRTNQGPCRRVCLGRDHRQRGLAGRMNTSDSAESELRRERVAATVAFFVSSAAGHVNGQLIAVTPPVS